LAAILSSEEVFNVLVAELGAKIPEHVHSVAALPTQPQLQDGRNIGLKYDFIRIFSIISS
jgi:hypothetical protein